jgi:hypothetical protein
VADRLAVGAGMVVTAAPAQVLAVDPDARLAVRLPAGAGADLGDRIGEWLASL